MIQSVVTTSGRPNPRLTAAPSRRSLVPRVRSRRVENVDSAELTVSGDSTSLTKHRISNTQTDQQPDQDGIKRRFDTLRNGEGKRETQDRDEAQRETGASPNCDRERSEAAGFGGS